MATIRLVPSSYDISNSSYVTVTNSNNMYDDTSDTSDYATLRGRAGRSSNSTYYAFINGFNFNDVPSNAEVTDFTIKIKAYRGSYMATGNTNYRICLASQASNSYKISNTSLSQDITTSTAGEVYEIPTGNLTWTQLVGYGSNFSIDIPLRNSSTSNRNYPYIYVYGAEIEVEYTMPNPRTITTTLTGNGTITPSGSNTYYDGDEVEVVITPTNKSDPVTAIRDGNDITSQLVAHGLGDTITIIPDDVTTTGISNGSSYAEYAVGRSAENPYSSSNNMYASSGSTGYAAYSFDFNSIPSNATIENIEVRCYGHRESGTIDSSHMSQCILYQGNSAISDEVDFPSTSNSIITITPNTMPTRTQLDNITLRHYVAYYGGLVLGISFEITYSTGTGVDHYTYTFTVSGNSTIAVTIGTVDNKKIYLKQNGSWVQYSKVYKKINGSWVEQDDWQNVFDTSANYVKG